MVDNFLASSSKNSSTENFYTVVGCDPASTMEQIVAEYKAKAMELHPDKASESASDDRFARLQEAKEVLCDAEKRKQYDQWLASGLTIPFREWLSNKNIMHMSVHWAPKKRETPQLDNQSDEQRKATDAIRAENASEVRWQRNDSDILRRFRNYQI